MSFSAPEPAASMGTHDIGLNPPPSTSSGGTFQATKVFTLAFFALALVICLILTAYITVMLLRRRRLRLAFAHAGMRPQVSNAYSQTEPLREIPLIQGFLVSHPDGQEQVAYTTGSLKTDKPLGNEGDRLEVVVADAGQSNSMLHASSTQEHRSEASQGRLAATGAEEEERRHTMLWL